MKFKLAIGAASALLLVGLGMALAGAVSGRFGIDLAAGQATVLRAEGEKAVADANAAAIQADTDRKNADAAQNLVTQSQIDTQWLKAIAGPLTALKWGGGIALALALSGGGVMFVWHLYIQNKRRIITPIQQKVGTLITTYFPGTGLTIIVNEDAPGWVIRMDQKGNLDGFGPDPRVLINQAQSRAIYLALKGLGYKPREAANAVDRIKQTIEAANASADNMLSA